MPTASEPRQAGPATMAQCKAEPDDWLTVYLKYLLFVFNFFFWVGGAAVMAVGIWTLVEKSGYLSVLASSTFAASAYILIFAGALVMATGFLGFGAIVREDRSCLSTKKPFILLSGTVKPRYGPRGWWCRRVKAYRDRPPEHGEWPLAFLRHGTSVGIPGAVTLSCDSGLPGTGGFSSHRGSDLPGSSTTLHYFSLLLVIFLVELVAGVLAHLYYQRLSDELRQHLTRTLAENCRQPGAAQPGAAEITASVDRLQQDFKCCGSNSSADWQHSTYILSREAEGRRVPDSCCKTVVARCGQRTHPSNIYKVEGGCITKLEQFLADHLLLMGAVGIGVACLQWMTEGHPPLSRAYLCPHSPKIPRTPHVGARPTRLAVYGGDRPEVGFGLSCRGLKPPEGPVTK
ncbi:hypothetical protein CB1_000388006 [Camelus ferus]|nr:hypothetical protein CB1_000388006 [Camelus ferus]